MAPTTTYAVHTQSCAYLLDENGVCHRLLAPGGLVNDSMGLAVGAQFVACLDLNEPGLLVTELRIGASALFARTDDDGHQMLLRTSPIQSIEVKMPGVVLPTSPIVTTPMPRPRSGRGPRTRSSAPPPPAEDAVMARPQLPSRPVTATPPTAPAAGAQARPGLRPPAPPTMPRPPSAPARPSLPPPPAAPSRQPSDTPPPPAARPAPPAPRPSQRNPAPRPGRQRPPSPVSLRDDPTIEGITALVVGRPLYQPTAPTPDPARPRAPAVPTPRTLLSSPPGGGSPSIAGRPPGPPYIPPEPPRARRRK